MSQLGIVLPAIIDENDREGLLVTETIRAAAPMRFSTQVSGDAQAEYAGGEALLTVGCHGICGDH